MWNDIDHEGHESWHHDVVIETPYHDYAHDIEEHHGEGLISDLEHDYDDLWQIIEGQSHFGVEHHDIETFDYYHPEHHGYDHHSMHDVHDEHHNDAHYEHDDHYGGHHDSPHHSHDSWHHDVVIQVPYHDYAHDMEEHHGQDLMSDLEHDYDELWQIIAGQSHYGIEHHDVEIYDYHNPAHDLDHHSVHDHEMHHNDAY